MLFTVESIEGNSHIGVPVFSRTAKKSNFHYLVFQTPKPNNAISTFQERSAREEEAPITDEFKVIS